MSWISFYVGTLITILSIGVSTVEILVVLKQLVLSPHVSSTILSIVSPYLLWQDVTYWTSNPLKSIISRNP